MEMEVDKGDHRVEMHRLATERRARGLPSWAERWPLKDLLGDDESDVGAATVAGKMAQRIRGKAGERLDEDSLNYDSTLGEIVWWFEDLAKELPNPMKGANSEFNDHLDELYDWADWNRVWIG